MAAIEQLAQETERRTHTVLKEIVKACLIIAGGVFVLAVLYRLIAKWL